MEKKKTPLAEKAKVLDLVGAGICALFVAINIVLIFVNVVMRYLFNSPILGVTELVALLMPHIAYFGIAYTAYQHAHVQMSAFFSNYKGRHKYISECIVYGLALALFILLVYVGMDAFITSVVKLERATSVVVLYKWWGKVAVPFGSLLMVIQTGCQFVDSLINAIRYRKGDMPTEASGE